MQFHETTSESAAKGQSLLKQLANILWENAPRPFADGPEPPCGSRQEGVHLARADLQGNAGDLSPIIDGPRCLQEIQRGVRRDERVEIRHHAILPEVGTFVAVYIKRSAHHLAFAVNAVAITPKVAGQRAEVGHHTSLPEEGVKGCVASQFGDTDHLTLVIDIIAPIGARAPEVAEVNNPAVLPEHGAKRGTANSRGAGGLAPVVDRISHCVRVLLWTSAIADAQNNGAAADLVLQFKTNRVWWQQFEVAEKLVKLRNTAVLEQLEPYLEDDDRHVRGNAAFVFAALGDDRGFGVNPNSIEMKLCSIIRRYLLECIRVS